MISGVSLSSIRAMISLSASFFFFSRCSINWSAVPRSCITRMDSSSSRCSRRKTSNSTRSTSSVFIEISKGAFIFGVIPPLRRLV